MPSCKFCGKQYDINDSGANNYNIYCSRSCELRGISAARDRENALIVADAARNQTDAYYKAADAAREKAEAYDRLRESQKRMEEDRKAEEKKQKKQELAREDLDDKRGMFVGDSSQGIKRREAGGGTREYKLGKCEVRNLKGGSETHRDSATEWTLHVNSLINKTPKGTGPLRFCLYYFSHGLKEPFVEEEDSSTGISYWKNIFAAKLVSKYKYLDENKRVQMPDYGFVLSPFNRPVYSSEEFSLKAGENIEDKCFALKRNGVPLTFGRYNLYLTLEETTDTKSEIVAWTVVERGYLTHDDSIVETKYGVYAKKGEPTKLSGMFTYSLPPSQVFFNVYKDKIRIRFTGIELNSSESDKLDNSSASIYMHITLKDVETDEVIENTDTDCFTLSYEGKLLPSVIQSGHFFLYESSAKLNGGVYEGRIELFEINAEDGKGRCVYTFKQTFFPKSACDAITDDDGDEIGKEISYKVIDGEELGEKFKGQKKLAYPDTWGANVSLKGVSYSIKDDNEVTININRLQNKSDEKPTGSLLVCLEYETNGKRTEAARFYKKYLKPGFSFPDISETVKYTRPKDYCDDSVPVISVYQLSSDKKWHRNNNNDVRWISKNQQKKQEDDRKAAEAKRLEREKQDRIKKQNKKKSNRLSKILMIVCFSSFFLWLGAYFVYKNLKIESTKDFFSSLIGGGIVGGIIGGIIDLIIAKLIDSFDIDSDILWLPPIICCFIGIVTDLTGCLSFFQGILLCLILAIPSIGPGLAIKLAVKGTKTYRIIAIITTIATFIIPIALIVFFKIFKH